VSALPALRPREDADARAPRSGAAVRPATLADVPALERVMAPYVATGDLLPRSDYDLCRHIKEYVVAEDGAGTLVACGSLKVYSRDLAELAGLAVRRDHQGAGLGRAIVAALLEEARRMGLGEVFALTRQAAFFARLGFRLADKVEFPLKVWADCARCPRRECCDEVAVRMTL
jgi:amino-acid N-acetyltransferase